VTDYSSPEYQHAVRLYQDPRWRRMRRHHLRLHPLCEVCLQTETVEPAAVVHHRQRHDGDEANFFDEGQLQSLCWDCRNALRR
jgi:5-methylcytosine-specific restriction protein A